VSAGGTGKRARASAAARPGRPLAEWIAFGVSLAVVVALVALVLAASRAGGEAVIVAEPRLAATRLEGGRYYVPLEIRNDGEGTAEEVRVVAIHSSREGKVTEAEVVIDLLATRERAEAFVSFVDDPRTGSLAVEVRSYRTP
jgi:uncharacterized protein (TIGR02588 family)